MPHKDDIHEGLYIMDKWHKVRILCLWFYRMKNLVDDRFDDIEAAITNSGEDIDIDTMNTNRKTPESIPPSTSPRTTSGSYERENHNAPELQNEEDIEWEKTDNENPSNDNITPTEPPPSDTPQPSIT